MKLFRTCTVTGKTFKRTASNHEVGSLQYYRTQHVHSVLSVLKDMSDVGSILEMATNFRPSNNWNKGYIRHVNSL